MITPQSKTEDNFIASLLSASVGETFDTSNRVLAFVEEERDMYARALIDLYCSVEDATETVTTRTLEKVLTRAYNTSVWAAKEMFQRKEVRA